MVGWATSRVPRRLWAMKLGPTVQRLPSSHLATALEGECRASANRFIQCPVGLFARLRATHIFVVEAAD